MSAARFLSVDFRCVISNILCFKVVVVIQNYADHVLACIHHYHDYHDYQQHNYHHYRVRCACASMCTALMGNSLGNQQHSARPYFNHVHRLVLQPPTCTCAHPHPSYTTPYTPSHTGNAPPLHDETYMHTQRMQNDIKQNHRHTHTHHAHTHTMIHTHHDTHTP